MESDSYGVPPLRSAHSGSGVNVSAVAIAGAVRAGESTAVAVVEAALARAHSAQERTNAFITICDETAVAAAERIDATVRAGNDPGPLAGVPLVVKDNLCTAGIRTTAGSRILEEFVPPYDATVVKRLVQAGAVVIGKANLDEFGMGSGNENSAYGPVRNPNDLGRVAGGSSGGSAAAVAEGAAPLALGSDTGGSSRLPAAFCGVIGFKPSYGALSRSGLIAYGSSLDQVGILGHNVADVRLAFELTTGLDEADATTVLPAAPAAGAGFANGELAGLRVGLLTEVMGAKADPDDGPEGGEAGFSSAALALVDRTAEQLRQRGAELVNVSVPSAAYAPACYYVAATAEASSNLARFDGTIFGGRLGKLGDGQEAVMAKVRSGLFGAEVKRRLLFGSLALSAGYYDQYYGRALKVRQLIMDQLLAVLKGVDVILLPAAAGVAFRLGQGGNQPFSARFGGHSYYSDLATSLANMAGLPSVCVPAGSEVGLPLSVQLLGRPMDDMRLLNLAAQLQAAS